jgi:hypothetical protein
MGDNGQHLQLDPLNPPKDFVVLSIIQYHSGRAESFDEGLTQRGVHYGYDGFREGAVGELV